MATLTQSDEDDEEERGVCCCLLRLEVDERMESDLRVAFGVPVVAAAKDCDDPRSSRGDAAAVEGSIQVVVVAVGGIVSGVVSFVMGNDGLSSWLSVAAAVDCGSCILCVCVCFDDADGRNGISAN